MSGRGRIRGAKANVDLLTARGSDVEPDFPSEKNPSNFCFSVRCTVYILPDNSLEGEGLYGPCYRPSLKLRYWRRIQAESLAVELIHILQGSRWHREVDVGDTGNHDEKRK